MGNALSPIRAKRKLKALLEKGKTFMKVEAGFPVKCILRRTKLVGQHKRLPNNQRTYWFLVPTCAEPGSQ